MKLALLRCFSMLLEDGERVVRCAIFPKYEANGVFSEENLWGFRPPTDGARDRVTSLGWRSVLKTNSDIHGYGHRTAALQTESKRVRFEAKGRAINPDKDISYYQGFFEFAVSPDIASTAHHHTITVEQAVEHGEEGHCNFTMRLKEGVVVDPDEIKIDRNRIIVRLMALCCGPEMAADEIPEHVARVPMRAACKCEAVFRCADCPFKSESGLTAGGAVSA